MLEYAVVILIVLAAAWWLGRRFVRWARGTGGDCCAKPAKPQRTSLTVGGRAVH